MVRRTRAAPKKKAKKTPRRTQATRTAEMRERLLRATIDCLVDGGYEGTTTIAVVARAKVSRGAIAHHFPTRAALVAAAVEYLLDERIQIFRARAKELDPGDRDGAVMALWHEFRGPVFDAWLELIVASRTNKELRKRVRAVEGRWADSVDLTFRELFGTPRVPDRHPLALGPIFAFVVMGGLRLELLARGDPTLEKRVLRVLQALASGVG